MKIRNKIITLFLILSLVTPILYTNVFAENEIKNTNLISTKEEISASEENLTQTREEENTNTKKFYDNTDPLPDIKIYSQAAILVDTRTGKVLYNKNSKERKYPASLTKILTAILVIEKCKMDDKVVVDYDSIMAVPSGYTIAALQVGEELTVKQLLQLLLIQSANDAANVLAKHVAGSIEEFAEMMNKKVKEIGCLDTHFTNPSGKHDDNHYTTAYDLALIMDYCLNNDTFLELTSSKSCIIPATNKYAERVYANSNDLLILDTREMEDNYYYPYAISGKTGYTSQANNCLVSAAIKDGIKLICVVLDGLRTDEGLSARFMDTKNLFEYGYNTFTIRKLRENGAIAKQIEVSNATNNTKELDLLINSEINVLIKQADLNKEIEPEIILKENIEAPIQKGDVLGKIKYSIEGITYEADLVASHEVKKNNFLFLLFQVVVMISVIFLLFKIIKTQEDENII